MVNLVFIYNYKLLIVELFLLNNFEPVNTTAAIF